LTGVANTLRATLRRYTAQRHPTAPAVFERVAETNKRVAELADQVWLLTELQQRPLWQKLRGAFQ